MKLLLTRVYRGRPSEERIITPGTYDVNDPRLLGLGEYLIKNGHAVRLYEVTDPEPATPGISQEALEAAVRDYLVQRGLVAIPAVPSTAAVNLDTAPSPEAQAVEKLVAEEDGEHPLPADPEPEPEPDEKPKTSRKK